MNGVVRVEDDGRVLVTPPSPAIADRVALLASGVTHAELWDRTTAHAHELVEAGVAPGSRVALWLDKGDPYVEWILATLLIGATYVPIDGKQPPLRASVIVDDCRPAALVLDGRRTLDPAAVAAGTVVLDAADDTAGASERTVQELPQVTVDPEDDAAILYTSGSTGRPKGVRIPHRMLAGFVCWARADLDTTPDDRFANHASFNFDISTLDLFVALSTGASLLVLGDEERSQPHALVEAIEQHRLTVWYSVPSALDLMVRSGHLTTSTTSSLRRVVFAGEPYPIKRLAALATLLPPSCTLANYYGPTETNVCTAYHVRPDDLRGEASLPIGRPIDGAHVRIVAEDGAQISEPGVVGELVVSGPCVTTGYVRSTGEPPSHPDGVHHTGDLVSRDASGELHFHGRADRMVKVGGHRVELAEVERVLTQHPAVDDAAVTLLERADRRELTAYLVANDSTLSTMAVRRWCVDRLPTYMIPHRLLVADALPRTANGKVDLARLR